MRNLSLLILLLEFWGCGGGLKNDTPYDFSAEIRPGGEGFEKLAKRLGISERWLWSVAYVEQGKAEWDGGGDSLLGLIGGDFHNDKEVFEAYGDWLEAQGLTQKSSLKDWSSKHRKHELASWFWEQEVSSVCASPIRWKDRLGVHELSSPRVMEDCLPSQQHPSAPRWRLGQIPSARRAQVWEWREELPTKEVEILHCSASLSACLDKGLDNGWAAAHYLIMNEPRIINWPIQLRPHQEILSEPHTLRILLVGPSGQEIDGQRSAPNPLWFTPWQSIKLGEILEDLQEMSPEGVLPINIRGTHPGNVPDLDGNMLKALLRFRPTSSNIFQISEKSENLFTFTLNPSFETQMIQMEELRPSQEEGSPIWETMMSMRLPPPPHEQPLVYSWYLGTAGPDIHNPDIHFIRAKFYNSQEQLIAWNTQTLSLRPE